MAKVIQINTCRMGDNQIAAEQMVTTILYDDGSVYEGWMEKVVTDVDPQTGPCGYEYEMKWQKLDLPK